MGCKGDQEEDRENITEGRIRARECVYEPQKGIEGDRCEVVGKDDKSGEKQRLRAVEIPACNWYLSMMPISRLSCFQIVHKTVVIDKLLTQDFILSLSAMKAFRIEGEFLMKDKWQKFVREVASKNKKSAVEYILSDIGGRHRTRRKNVRIHDVKQVKPEEIENQLVGDTVEGGKSGK